MASQPENTLSIFRMIAVCLQSGTDALECLSDQRERPDALQVVEDAFEGLFKSPFRTIALIPAYCLRKIGI